MFDPKPSEAAVWAPFSNFDKCRPEVDGNVISGVAVDKVGMDVLQNWAILRQTVAKRFDSLASSTRFMHFYAVFDCILHPTESS